MTPFLIIPETVLSLGFHRDEYSLNNSIPGIWWIKPFINFYWNYDLTNVCKHHLLLGSRCLASVSSSTFLVHLGNAGYFISATVGDVEFSDRWGELCSKLLASVQWCFYMVGKIHMCGTCGTLPISPALSSFCGYFHGLCFSLLWEELHLHS